MIDNASTDSTVEIARAFEKDDSRVTVKALTENLGFAAANNLAVQISSGEYLMLLNPDTVVSGGWLGRLKRVLASNISIGLASAVTNYAGNEIKVESSYSNCDQMLDFAADRARGKFDELFDLEMAPLMACMCTRAVWDDIGGLDSDYRWGMFEDDDFCVHLRRRGLRIVAAEDCFIHHFGQSSFSQLSSEEYDEIFEMNRKRFEDKWKVEWRPHRHREGVAPPREEKGIPPEKFFYPAFPI